MPIAFDATKISDLIEQEEDGDVAEFARKTGSSRQKVSNWLTNGVKPNMDSFVDICNAYDVEVEYFFVKNNVIHGNT